MTKKEIGQVIKESRLAAELTQLQVAEALGRPQQTIANWELGRSQPDANTLFALFKILGRSVDEAFGFSVRPFTFTFDEQELVKRYRCLDQYGRRLVCNTIDHELIRCSEQPSPRKIPLFLTLSAVGMPSPALGVDYEEIEAERGAIFAVMMAGDTMEPVLKDGDIVFVERAPVQDGDIGIFSIDGEVLCKQYYWDQPRAASLQSVNRARSDDDRVVGEDADLVCLGRVICPR